jgi:hypothetical protein
MKNEKEHKTQNSQHTRTHRAHTNTQSKQRATATFANMVRNADDSSFITWISTLHPEIARIDPRFQDESPWVTVYNEAYSEIPVAVQVVDLDEDLDTTLTVTSVGSDEEQNRPQREAWSHQHESEGATTSTSRLQPWKHSNFIDLIIGLVLTLVAVYLTFMIELNAIIFYMTAAGFHWLAEEVFSSPATLLFKSICLVVTPILMFVDFILLTVSVMVTEILGAVTRLLCTIVGGPRSGLEWHQ